MQDDAQLLDTNAVAEYLRGNLSGFAGPLKAQKFSDGQSNPTFLLTTPDVNYVLRRKPPGVLLKSAHAVDREYRVQKALEESDVPVARMHLLCEDDEVIGSSFYVMEHVPGRIFFDPRLPHISNANRTIIINDMCHVLSAIHSVDIGAAGLTDYGAPGSYIERQVKRWSKQYRASETGTIPAMDRLMDMLDERMPEDDAQRCLVHGDYRIDNLMFFVSEPRCVAVLDWELSTIGHPLADLASVIMQWQLPPGPEGRGLAGVDRCALGLLKDEEFISTYCKKIKIQVTHDLGYFLAFSFFRMAAVLQGVKKRALDGNASNPEKGIKMGQYISVFADKGVEALGDV